MSATNETKPLDLESLKKAVTENAAAFRCRRRLQPAGGPGDKVFPPTFAGAVYAVERRHVPGRPEAVMCVVLDTVQAQANRMEQALQDALDSKSLTIPVLNVDFSQWSPTGDVDADRTAGRLVDAVGTITSLQAPHRLADAILRDSLHGGQPFRRSDLGRSLDQASVQNATPLYRLCPTALIFGMWDSTGPKGGLGAKFERAVVSEVVGVGARFGLRTASRIDPLITKTEGIEVFEAMDGTWTLDKNAARKDPKTNRPVLFGKGQKRGKVSNANLGNVTPSFTEYGDGAEGPDPLKVQQLEDSRLQVHLDSPEALRQLEARKSQIAAGGATIEYAEQVTTLSLIALRRLRFPAPDKTSPEVDAAGRTVLAALALCAATLAFESGMGLRSRCLLWPEGPMTWELLDKPGAAPRPFTITRDEAITLLKDAIAAAKRAGLDWEDDPIELTPQQELVELVRRSQTAAANQAEDGES